MIDFNDLLDKEDNQLATEPRQLFLSLVRKPEYEYLRDVQQDILEAWYPERNKQKDFVIKMNTGAGKTLVGLLMQQSSLNEGVGPALYLCPNTQLVKQVVAHAEDYGIPTVQFSQGSNELPADFVNGDAILVTTFQKLFNGHSIFGVQGGYRQFVELGCVLIDDAHSCLTIAREEVTVTFKKEEEPYQLLLSIFRHALETQSVGTAAGIQSGDPSAFLQVPYWAWMEAIQDVARILSELRETDNLKFSWNLIKDNLELCYCLMSGSQIQITPYLVPVEKIPSLVRAKRRFFLSATLVDDSVLIKEFGVSENAVNKPLKPQIKGDIGERMIIAPNLIDSSISKESIVQLMASVSKKFNVVVLVPSFKAAETWRAAGAVLAERDKPITEVLDLLQGKKGNFVVMANRYDGIDLPGNCCRVLVMDGLPTGGSFYEQFMTASRPNSKQLKINQAQKVEQGLGRGVRSGGDYCAVILLDSSLISFITLKPNQALLSPETRRQIEIGQQLAKQLQNDGGDSLKNIITLLKQCLNRDQGWVKYHRKKLSDLLEAPQDDKSRKIAFVERSAIQLFQSGQAGEGANLLLNELRKIGTKDEADLGWYHQIAASLLNKAEPEQSQQLQRKAHELNTQLLKPLAGIKYKQLIEKNGLQGNRVLKWVQQHTEPNSIPVAVNSMISKLAFGIDSDLFEQAVADLARVLGFFSQRPEKEYGKGPDALWLMSDGHYLVIEAKNEVKTSRPTISKKEISQLSNSTNWFLENYEDKPFTPVMIHPSNEYAPDAFGPEGTMVINEDKLSQLVHKVEELAAALSDRTPESWTVEDMTDLLKSHQLTPQEIRSRFFIKPKKSAAKKN